MSINKLLEHISIMLDPCQQGKVEHKLTDILLLTICAVIAGAEGWKEIGDFDNGIPDHDTIGRVISLIDAKMFQQVFVN